MSNFEHRITEDSTEFEKAFLKIYDGNLWTALDKMKDWQPPKPLVIVPEDVDKAIKYLKTQNNFATLTDLEELDILTEKGFWWLNDFQFKDRRFGFGGLNNKLFILSHLAITGYQVEKPQLFYLKNEIKLEDVGSDLIGYVNLFLTNNGYLTSNINRAKKFTQQEIDSMQTGSYEQIEVKVEEVEK